METDLGKELNATENEKYFKIKEPLYYLGPYKMVPRYHEEPSKEYIPSVRGVSRPSVRDYIYKDNQGNISIIWDNKNNDGTLFEEKIDIEKLLAEGAIKEISKERLIEERNIYSELEEKGRLYKEWDLRCDLVTNAKKELIEESISPIKNEILEIEKEITKIQKEIVDINKETEQLFAQINSDSAPIKDESLLYGYFHERVAGSREKEARLIYLTNEKERLIEEIISPNKEKIMEIEKDIIETQKNMFILDEEIDELHDRLNVLDVRITHENVKEFSSFDINKDIKLKDGTFIEKGTRFMIGGENESGRSLLHFRMNPNNTYTNETAEYYFPHYQVKEFAQVSSYAFRENQIKDMYKEAFGKWESVYNTNIPEELQLNKKYVSLYIKEFELKKELDNQGQNYAEIIAKMDKVKEEMDSLRNISSLLKEEREANEKIHFDQSDSKEGIVFSDDEVNLKEVNKIYRALTSSNAFEAWNDIDGVIVSPSPKDENKYQVTFHVNYEPVEEWQYDNALDVAKMINKMNYEIKDKYIVKEPFNMKGLAGKVIKNEKVLERIGEIVEKVNIIKLKDRPVSGKFDFKHMEKINNKIYSMYELPEKDRLKVFACKDILRSINKENIGSVKSIDEFAEKIEKHIVKLNKLQVFPKGNTETIKQFTKSLGRSVGFDIDLSKVSKDQFEYSCIKANEGQAGALKDLIKESTLNKEPIRAMAKDFERMIGLER